MTRFSRLPTLIATVAVSLGICGSAQAAIVTVGSPLTQTFVSAPITADVLATNASLPESGANIASPLSGAVVRWRIVQAAGGPFRLRVLRPLGGSTYMPVATSTPATASSLGVQTFSTNLPISTGDTVAIEAALVPGNQIGLAGPVAGASYLYWAPPLAEGAAGAGTAIAGTEIAFDAEVQPSPTISAIGPGSGSVTGGIPVTITGTDLEGASAVRFGSVAASTFTVDSETQITAVAPAAAAGPVAVSVSTIAGTGISSQLFTYQAPAPPTPAPPVVAKCVVPNLFGKHLKAAKKKIRGAGCKVGNVVKLDGVTAKAGRVVKQNPKGGKMVAVGSKVNLKLGS